MEAQVQIPEVQVRIPVKEKISRPFGSRVSRGKRDRGGRNVRVVILRSFGLRVRRGKTDRGGRNVRVIVSRSFGSRVRRGKADRGGRNARDGLGRGGRLHERFDEVVRNLNPF